MLVPLMLGTSLSGEARLPAHLPGFRPLFYHCHEEALKVVSTHSVNSAETLFENCRPRCSVD